MGGNSQQRSGVELLWFVLLAVALGALMFAGRNSSGRSGIADDTPLPEMMATGWLNTDTIPSPNKLLGKVVVVDCWATWCPPCRASMPKLAKLYEQYQPMGVAFIGLTPEPESDRAAIENFMNSVPGFNWPVGYGSAPTLNMLGVDAFPTVIVFNAQGVATWSSTSLSGIENALDQALAMAEK